MRNLLSKSLKAGMPSIFISSFVNQLVQFCGGMFLVRVLSKSDYGVFAYSFNIISFFLLLNTGLTAAVLQFCSENNTANVQNAYFFLGMKYSVFINFLSVIVLWVVSRNNLLSVVDANEVLLIMVFIPLLAGSFGCYLAFQRAKILNNIYSISSSLNAVLLVLLTVSGAYLFGIKGAVAFQYIAYLSSLSFVIIITRKYHLNICSQNGTIINKWSFINYSILSFLATAIGQLVYILDVFLIGIILKTSYDVAVFRVASFIPYGMLVIPISLMTFVYPYFAKRKNDTRWIIKHTSLLMLFLFFINLIIVVPLIVVAPKIIFLFFGSKYATDKNLLFIFRLLMVGYLIGGTFRVPLGNILAMIRRTDLAFISSALSAVVGVVLAYVFIHKFGVVGAAYSTFVVFSFSSLLGFLFYLIAIKR